MSKKQFIVECISIICILAVMIWYLGILFRPVDADGCFVDITTFHSIPDNTLDVICYGSSHGGQGIYTPKLNEDLGIRSYNYGCSWQQLNTEKLFLEDSLRTQNPKVAIIETYRAAEVIEGEAIDGEVYYSRAMSDFPGKRAYLRQCLGDDPMINLSYYVPFVAFHENWMNITGESFWRSDKPRPYEDTWGSSNALSGGPVYIPEDACSVQKTLPEKSLACLNDIVRICNEHDIKIIFYTTPCVEGYAYGDAMAEYAREHDCVYVNFFDKMKEAGIDENTDFRDGGHLCKTGAEKVAVYLEPYIKELLKRS